MRNRTPLTEKEKQIAANLKAIWDAKKKELGYSQLSASVEMGFASQSTVSQFLNAGIALNTDAKLKFAKLLRVSVSEFDPDFAENAEFVARDEILNKATLEMADMSAEQINQVIAYAAGLKQASQS